MAECFERFSKYVASLRDTKSVQDIFGTPIHSCKRKYPGAHGQWEHRGASYSRKKGHQGYQRQQGKGGRGGGKYQQGGRSGARNDPYYSNEYAPQWQDWSALTQYPGKCRICKQ